MEEVLVKNIEAIMKTAGRLVELGWAESFFGNISVLIDPIDEHLDIISSFPAPVEIPVLNGLDILVTRTTSTMEEVANSPEESIGLYRINGRSLDLLWGAGPPSSELSSHLLSYSTGRGQAIVHCHMDDVHRLDHNSCKEHPLPKWVKVIGEIEPGSIELAEATRDAIQYHDTILWKGHGALAMTEDLRTCLDRLSGLEGYLKGIPE